MVYTLYSALLGSAVLFINLSHPVGLGLTLILHTLLISVATGLAAGNFWFSYILFLVFLGGVLVLFIYMTSLASNEKFALNWSSLLMVLLVMSLLFLGGILYFCPAMDSVNMVVDWQIVGFNLVDLKSMVMKLYSAGSYSLTIMLIFYLLYALLVCANIVSKYSGALRNFN